MSSQIHDLGYRAYEGERAGVSWAVRSLAVHSVRRALGLKRPGKHKIAPILTIAFAFVPAIIFAGLAALLGSEIADELISYGEYYGFVSFAMLLFTAAAAPGVLTTDRTTGMLAMYLASPLNRSTYVLAKLIGLFVVLLTVTAAPIVFLVLANTLAGAGPDGIIDFIDVLVRAVVAGTLIALVYTGIGMFVSSWPRRWGIASVSIFGTIFVSDIVTSVLTEEADASPWVALAAPNGVMYEAWQRVLDSPVDDFPALDDRSTAVILLVAMAYAAVLMGATWWRYQTIEVER